MLKGCKRLDTNDTKTQHCTANSVGFSGLYSQSHEGPQPQAQATVCKRQREYTQASYAGSKRVRRAASNTPEACSEQVASAASERYNMTFNQQTARSWPSQPLRLICQPFDQLTAQRIAAYGHNPQLQLDCRPERSMSSLLYHLEDKWEKLMGTQLQHGVTIMPTAAAANEPASFNLDDDNIDNFKVGHLLDGGSGRTSTTLHLWYSLLPLNVLRCAQPPSKSDTSRGGLPHTYNLQVACARAPQPTHSAAAGKHQGSCVAGNSQPSCRPDEVKQGAAVSKGLPPFEPMSAIAAGSSEGTATCIMRQQTQEDRATKGLMHGAPLVQQSGSSSVAEAGCFMCCIQNPDMQQQVTPCDSLFSSGKHDQQPHAAPHRPHQLASVHSKDLDTATVQTARPDTAGVTHTRLHPTSNSNGPPEEGALPPTPCAPTKAMSSMSEQTPLAREAADGQGASSAGNAEELLEVESPTLSDIFADGPATLAWPGCDAAEGAVGAYSEGFVGPAAAGAQQMGQPAGSAGQYDQTASFAAEQATLVAADHAAWPHVTDASDLGAAVPVFPDDAGADAGPSPGGACSQTEAAALFLPPFPQLASVDPSAGGLQGPDAVQLPHIPPWQLASPKPLAAEQGSAAVELDEGTRATAPMPDIAKCFHMSAISAQKQLGLTADGFCQAMGALGLKKWPYDNIKRAVKRIEKAVAEGRESILFAELINFPKLLTPEAPPSTAELLKNAVKTIRKGVHAAKTAKAASRRRSATSKETRVASVGGVTNSTAAVPGASAQGRAANAAPTHPAKQGIMQFMTLSQPAPILQLPVANGRATLGSKPQLQPNTTYDLIPVARAVAGGVPGARFAADGKLVLPPGAILLQGPGTPGEGQPQTCIVCVPNNTKPPVLPTGVTQQAPVLRLPTGQPQKQRGSQAAAAAGQPVVLAHPAQQPRQLSGPVADTATASLATPVTAAQSPSMPSLGGCASGGDMLVTGAADHAAPCDGWVTTGMVAPHDVDDEDLSWLFGDDELLAKELGDMLEADAQTLASDMTNTGAPAAWGKSFSDAPLPSASLSSWAGQGGADIGNPPGALQDLTNNTGSGQAGPSGPPCKPAFPGFEAQRGAAAGGDKLGISQSPFSGMISKLKSPKKRRSSRLTSKPA